MMPKPIVRPAMPLLAIDSGAHSFYQKIAAPRSAEGKIIRGVGFADKIDHSYSTTKQFAKYLDSYVEWIRQFGDHLEFCVSLDVPLNAKRSWETYVEMTNQGVNVLPVYHYGEEIKWLDKYLDRTDYIGIGGLVRTGDKLSSFSFREKTWARILNGKGRPRAKIHAFGIGTADILRRHPYYSSDSTTAFTWSRYGCVMVPKKTRDHKSFDYFTLPIVYPVTPLRRNANLHIDGLHPHSITRAVIEEYVEQIGLEVEDVQKDYGHRDTVNLFYMNQLMEEMSRHHSQRMDVEHKMIYYSSGNFTESLEKYMRSMRHLERRGRRDHLAYLGTYYAISPLANLAAVYGINVRNGKNG